MREADYLRIFCWDDAKIVSEPSQKGGESPNSICELVVEAPKNAGRWVV